eukprot:TRINITY_DN16607_c0_g1_i1.p1 TRINITY_DN16607_c0_g1~~TRINITY_DN16607_c0_g1_i1.p1  ORF type:complete len:359 (+),score=33.22 TRINITY_DN16607_c0_g1_i1:146-1222(+)
MPSGRGLLLLGSAPKVGRTTACIGLISELSKTSKVGFLQWGQGNSIVEVTSPTNKEKYKISKDVIVIKEGCNVNSTYDEMKLTDELSSFKRQYDQLAATNDFVIVSGTGHPYAMTNGVTNLHLAYNLSIPVATVCLNEDDSRLHDRHSLTILNKFNGSNKASAAVVPFSPVLSELTVNDVFVQLRDATPGSQPQYSYSESDKIWSVVNGVRLVTTAVEIFKMSDIIPNTLFVVSSTRQDLVRVLALELRRRRIQHSCSIVLVSEPGAVPDYASVFSTVRLELPEDFPAFHIFGDPVSVAVAVSVARESPPQLQFSNARKIAEIKKLFSHVDLERLIRETGSMSADSSESRVSIRSNQG